MVVIFILYFVFDSKLDEGVAVNVLLALLAVTVDDKATQVEKSSLDS